MYQTLLVTREGSHSLACSLILPVVRQQLTPLLVDMSLYCTIMVQKRHRDTAARPPRHTLRRVSPT